MTREQERKYEQLMFDIISTQRTAAAAINCMTVALDMMDQHGPSDFKKKNKALLNGLEARQIDQMIDKFTVDDFSQYGMSYAHRCKKMAADVFINNN